MTISATPASDPPIVPAESTVTPFQLRWPTPIRDQVTQYARNLGIPINSAVMIFVNDGLKAAGFPGAAGSAHSDHRGD